jgi:hypothetical protein
MRLGIAHHFGWAVAVTASADHEVVDRRRIELIEPGVPAAPIHHEGGAHAMHRSAPLLGDEALEALLAKVRASAVRATSAALDEVAAALSEPILSMSVRAWPVDFPDEIAVRRRVPTRAVRTPSCTAKCWPSSSANAVGRSTATTPSVSRPTRTAPGSASRRGAARPAGAAGTAVVEGPPDGTGGDRRRQPTPQSVWSVRTGRGPDADRPRTLRVVRGRSPRPQRRDGHGRVGRTCGLPPVGCPCVLHRVSGLGAEGPLRLIEVAFSDAGCRATTAGAAAARRAP